MSSINSSYTTRITGIATGIDTDALVQKLTAGTTTKINRIKQQKQLLEWKLADYRSIIAKMTAFRDKYLSSSSTTFSGSFFAARSAVTERAEDSRHVSISLPSNCDLSSIVLSNVSVATASVATSHRAVSKQITLGFDSAAAPVDLTGKSMAITVGGVTKAITFSKAYNTAEELAGDIAQLADSVFGADRLSVSLVDGNIVINSDGIEASVSADSDVFSVAGMAVVHDKTTRLDMSRSLAESALSVPIETETVSFTINDVPFSFSTDTAMSVILNTINNSSAGVKISYSSLTDKFTVKSTATGEASGISFADEEGNFLASIIGPVTEENYTLGKDASVYINGVKVTRSTNTFSIDGITYTLKEDTAQEIKVNIVADTKAAVDNIKAFVNDYNELLELINAKLSEEKFRDYAPLTDEQKESMSEKQIEQWEEKAKSGLLRNDSTLRNIANALRAIMYTPVADLADNSVNIATAMASIGIATENYTTRGKLAVDEQKLTAALESNLEGVIQLFTQKSDKSYLVAVNNAETAAERYKESGILHRMADIFEDNVGTLYKTGALLRIAGYEGTSSVKNNMIYRSIASYESKLDRLYDLLKKEETRYYNQFAAMEKSVSQLNQQIQYVTGRMG